MEPRGGRSNEEAIFAGLTAVVEPGSIFEVRALKARRPGRTFEATWSGYFDDITVAAHAIIEVDGLARGVYCTLNPVDSTLLARSTNRMREIRSDDPTTKDVEVHRRSRLLIDVDPVRPSGISSTDAEHEAAIDRCRLVRGELLRLGAPDMLLVDSGNGAQLVTAIDLPADDGGLVKRVLAGLAFRFDDDVVRIDTGNFNPSRIVKIPGTMTRKGDNTPERPHRRAQVLNRPETLNPIDRKQLEVIASWAPAASALPTAARNGKRLHLDAWLSRYGIETRKPRAWNGGTLVDIPCPINPEHGFDAWVGQDAAGMLSAGCFHVTCTLKSWADLRGIYEPRRRATARPATIRPNPSAEPETRPTSDDPSIEEPPHPADAGGDEPRSHSYLWSDAGNADCFVDDHRDNVRFSSGLGWLVWDGRRWKQDDAELVVELGIKSMRRRTLRAMNRYDDEREKAIRFALKSEAAPRITGMLTLSRPRLHVDISTLDADPWVLNVENGTLDLRTGKLRPHRREDFLTHLSPVAYDPGAAAPLWNRFIERVLRVEVRGHLDEMESASLRAYVQRSIGYCLTGSARERCLFILFGRGRNGKTVCLEVVSFMLGPELARTINFNTLLHSKNSASDGSGPSEHIARLRGARLVTAMEPNDGKRFDESLLKLLTGGDSVPARHHYRATFQFTPQFKLAVGANHRVRITGTDKAIWDRIKQLPFTQRISDEEKDDDLRQKIVTTELPGVLAWALRGCVEWQRAGLGSCNAVELSTQDYRQSQNTIGTFLEDCCLVGPEYWVSSENLMSAYTAWADRTGEPHLSAKTLADRLGDQDGIEAHRKSKARGWRGLAIAASPEMTDDAS